MSGRAPITRPRDLAGCSQGTRFSEVEVKDPVLARAVEVARNIECMLDVLMEQGVITSMSDFSAKSGISHASIGRVIRGERWINGELLARLEHTSGFRLWGEHAEKISEPSFDVKHK